MKRHIPFIVSILAIAACQQPTTTLSPADAKAIIDSIQLTLNNYNADVKASGLTAEFKFLDQSPDFFWVPPGFTSAISYDSVASILTQNAPLFKTIDNSYETLRIIPLSKELATYTARINSTSMDTTGQVTSASLLETGLLIKRKDGWKLLNGQTAIVEQ